MKEPNSNPSVRSVENADVLESDSYSPSFYTSVALSVVVHLSVFGWFVYQRPSLNHQGHGVVSVNFIQSVSHHSENETKRVREKGVSTHQNEKSEQSTNSPERPEQQETPGDPQAIAHESDIFIAAITKLVERSKIFPKEAIDREEEGKVLVAVSLDRDGRLLDSRVEEPSPFELLNNAALKTVRSIDKYPEVPVIVPVPIHLHIPLLFRIEKN